MTPTNLTMTQAPVPERPDSSGAGAALDARARGIAMAVTARQLKAEATFRLVARALDSRGIEHLLVKGPHVAVLAYDAPWQRGYGDLDVLVRSSDFNDALAVLFESGFFQQPVPPGREATLDVYYNRHLLAPNGWLVELHRSLAGNRLFRVDYDGFFARAVDFRFGQTDARGLALEDLLLSLVIHAGKSQFRFIAPMHVRDIAELVARQPIHWDTFLARAEAFRCRTAAWVLFTAAENIHGAEIPPEVMQRLRPSRLRRWWIGLWLRLDQFPLFRRPRLPWGVGRAVTLPAIVDRLRDGMLSGLRYVGLRLMDVIRYLRSPPGYPVRLKNK